MIAEARDFEAESTALAEKLTGFSDDDFRQVTQFKDWTIRDIIAHLHMWNQAAAQTLKEPEKFREFITWAGGKLLQGVSHTALQQEYFGTTPSLDLYTDWVRGAHDVADTYHAADPDQRVNWAGPDMSARASIIARQMETWAHGQAVFDRLGLERDDTDRLKNIAHLGVTTYSWTFRVNGLEPPKPKPHVRLTAPSGAIWEWNDPQEDNVVTGPATEFCQIVTQTRNVADTDIQACGAHATRWMEIAQCFAGGPETPPAPGTRFKADAT